MEFGAETLDMMVEQPEVMAETMLEPAPEPQGGEPKQTQQSAKSLVKDMYDYMVKTNVVDAKKFPTVEKFALDLAGDDAILPEIYSYLQTDAKVKGLPDYKTFSGIVGAELAEYKKKVPTQPVSGGGGQTSSTVGQMPATEGEYQVPTTIAGIQQSLNRPVKAKEQYYVPPAKTTADLVGIDKVIAQINPNADFTPVKGNKEEYAQAKAELLDEWNRKKRTGQLDTGKSGSKAATPDKFLADNLDARASEKALKRQRAYNITEGVVNMSVKDGIDTIKAELTRQEGQAGLERRAREGEAKFATDKELKATGMYLQSLGKVMQDLEKNAYIPETAKRLIEQYGIANNTGNLKRSMAVINGLPDDGVMPQVKQYIELSLKYQEAYDRNKKAYKETGIDKQIAKDIVAAKVSAIRMVNDPIGAFGQLVVDKVLVPMVEGIGNLPKVASKMMSLNEGGETAKAVDGVADRFSDMAANFTSLLESEGSKALRKYSMFDENSPIPRGQIAFDNLAGALGFMASIGLSGAGASAAGAGKVGQAATTVANSFLQVHNDYYQSGLEAGLTEAQAGKYAIGNALVTSALELVAPDARFFGNAAKGFAKVPKPLAMKSAQEFAKVLASGGTIKQAVKAGSKIVVKEVLPEYGQEGLQLLADKGVNAITNEVIDNDLLDTSVTAEEAGTTFVMTTAATGLMASLGLRGRVANQLELDAIGNVITGDYNQNALQLKDALDNLKVDPEKQKQIFGRLNTIRDSYNSFNQLGLPEENTIKAAMADAELRGLKKRMADMPEALQPKVQERIGQLSAYINEQLKQPAPAVVETVQAEKQAEPAQTTIQTVETEQVQPQNAAPTQEAVTEQVTAEPVATPEQTAAPMPAPAPVPPAPAQSVTPKPTTPQPVQGQPLTPKLPEQPTAKEYGDLQDVVVSADKKVVTAQVPEVDSRVIVGAETQIKNPDNTALRGRYVLVPIPAAKPSHLSSQGFAQNPLYPTDAEGRSFNERNYQDPNSQQKVLDTIAKELDPDRLITNSKESNTGMPVLDANMAVISGNGRTMALQALANDSSPEAQQKLAEYQDAIVSEAANYGFSKEAIASMGGQPFMLARVVAEPGYQWGRVESALMNRSTTQATTSASIAQRVTTEANAKPEVVGQLNRLVQNEVNTKSAINKNGIGMLNALVSGGILTNEEVSAYQNENGVTPEGKTLLENILLGQVLDAQEVKYLYDNMSDAGGVRESILNVLPQLLATKSQKEWSLIEPLREVMTTWRSGLDEYNATTQPSIDKPAASQLSSLLGLVFKRGSNQAREILGAYVEAAQNANASVGMLGNMPTPAEVLANILKPYETKGTGKKLVEFVLNPKNREQVAKPVAKKAKEQATEMVASVEPAVASESVATETVEAKPAEAVETVAPEATVETVSEPEIEATDLEAGQEDSEEWKVSYDADGKPTGIVQIPYTPVQSSEVISPERESRWNKFVNRKRPRYLPAGYDYISVYVELDGEVLEYIAIKNRGGGYAVYNPEYRLSDRPNDYKREGKYVFDGSIDDLVKALEKEHKGSIAYHNQKQEIDETAFLSQGAIDTFEQMTKAQADAISEQGKKAQAENAKRLAEIKAQQERELELLKKQRQKEKRAAKKAEKLSTQQPQTPQEQTIDAPIQSLEPNKSKEVEQPEPIKVKKQPVSKGKKQAQRVEATSPAQPVITATYQADGNDALNLTVTVDSSQPAELATTVTIPDGAFEDLRTVYGVLQTIYGGQWTRQGNNFVAQVKQGQLQDFLDEVDSLYEVKATTKNATANVVAANRAQAQQNQDNDSKVWQSSATTQKGKNVQGLIAQLSMAFPNLTVVADPASVKAAQNALDIQSAGFVKDGVVYIDPDNISDEATVEEFAHIWLDIAKQTNPTLHERMLNLAADSPYMDAVNNDPTYQNYTPYKKRVEAAAKAIADAGVAYNNKFTITRLLSSFWDGIKAALSKYGIRHPMQNTNFGKVKLVDVAKLAAKDLFRAADGQLYAKNLNWARKWILDGEYWLPVSNMTSQTAYRVNFTGDVGTQSALSASNINNTANRWYLFLSTYFGTRRRILGDTLALISVKDTARKNRVQRIVSAFQQDLITAIEAETEHRLKAMKANNPNVSKSDIIDQVELDFHNAFTGLSPQNIQSAEGQKFLVSGKVQFEEAQRELIEFERKNGRALTTTKELESMLRDQFLAKRRLDSDEALINEQMEADLETYANPSLTDLELLRNQRNATQRNLKRLMDKFNRGMAAVKLDASVNKMADINNMIQRAYASLEKARYGMTQPTLASELEVVRRTQGAAAAQALEASIKQLEQDYKESKKLLAEAQDAYNARLQTLTLPEQQAMDLLQLINEQIDQELSQKTGTSGFSANQQASKLIRETAATKRKIAKLRSLMAVPMSMKFKKGPNGTNISFMFGDGTVQNVGELDEITIRKLQGLGQPAWQYIVNGGNSGVYMIPRPDLMMNNYMLEKLSDSLGQYVTRFYNKHDRTTDWAKMARQRIGDVAWGQATNYIRKQLTNSKPKSIVYNKDTQQFYVINEAGVESVVPNLNAFIDQMVKHNMPDVDIVGVRSLMGPKTSRYDFSYDGRLRMLADKGSMGLMFVPTQSQIDDVISDIVSQDSVAQTKTAGGGNFNEGIFKYRKDIPEPIRLLMGEVTTASVSLPNTLEYILTAVGRIHTEQALYDTGVISDQKTPYHTYQVRFYSPPNKAGNVMAADEKIGFRREVWTTPEVAELIFNQFDKGSVSTLLRVIAGYSAITKSFNTVYAVGSQARNFISSTIFSKILGGRYGFGSNTNALADAAKIADFMVQDFKGREKTLKAASLLQQVVQFTAGKFSKLSETEVESLFLELEAEGVISSTLDLQTVRALHELTKTAGRIDKSKISGWFNKLKLDALRKNEIMQRIYGLGDDMNKIAAYLYEKRRLEKLQTKLGLTDQQVKEQAAAIVRATIPNYDEAARVFKLISKTPILASFPLYPAEVFRTGYNTLQLGIREINQGYQLKEKSLVTQGMKRVAGVIMTASMHMMAKELVNLLLSVFFDDKEMLNDQELETMRGLMPDYAQNNIFTAWKDLKTSEVSYLDLSYILPFSQITQAQIAATKPGGGYFDAMYELIKPFVSMDMAISLLIQLFNNEDAYGNKIYQEQTQQFNITGDPALQAVDRGVKRFFDYLAFMRDRGGLPKVFKEAFGIANAALGNVKANGEIYNLGTETSSVFLGIKANKFTPANRVKSIARYSYDRYQEAAQVMTSALNDKRLSKQDLIARRQLAEYNMTTYFNELVKLARGSNTFNVPEDELFGTRRKGKFKNNGLFAEAQIPATMREKVYDALNDPDYKFVPEFSKENEKRYQEELETRE